MEEGAGEGMEKGWTLHLSLLSPMFMKNKQPSDLGTDFRYSGAIPFWVRVRTRISNLVCSLTP